MSQQLVMPFVRQMMLCGYKNPEYKKYWGYEHYGVDISTIQGNAGSDPTVYASGEGVVLAAGRDSRLGWGLCVLYRGCRSKNGDERDLVFRYMHLGGISVKAGDTVHAGQAMATEGREGTEDYHLHLEADTDTRERFAAWSPQVAGSSFWKKGTDSTVSPALWLFVGEGQAIADPVYNKAWLGEDELSISRVEKMICPCADALFGQAVRRAYEEIRKVNKCREEDQT